MDVLMVAMRLVHILFGVFWAGTLFFIVLYLEPSVRAAGPDGAKVMLGIQQRKFMTVIPVAGLLTIISGLYMYDKVSVHMADGWISRPLGMSLTIGAVVSIVAFIIGIAVLRPATLAAGALMTEIMNEPENAGNEDKEAQVQTLRLKARRAAKSVAHLLAVAVVTMAVARYL